MNYSKHYNKLIERAKNRLLECYTERHHIVPKCMGGSDDADNLVRLTPEEHYVAHQLLVKMYPENYKLLYAARAMTMLDIHQKRSRNKEYSWLRKKFVKRQSEFMTGNTFGVGRTPWNKGKTWSDETKKKMSVAKLGIKRPDVANWTGKKVVINGIEYSTCRNAAKALDVHYNTITRWIKQNKVTIV